mgnify:FL=1
MRQSQLRQPQHKPKHRPKHRPKHSHLYRPIGAWTIGFLIASLGLTPVASAQTLEERVARLERKADNPILLQMSRKLGEQQKQLQQLFNQLDRVEHDLQQIQKTQTERYQDNENRITELEGALKTLKAQAQRLQAASASGLAPTKAASESSQTQDAAKPAADAQTAESTSPEDTSVDPAPVDEVQVKKAYQAAFAQLKNSDYEAAIDAFKQFINAYETHPLAANAAYWQGEALSVLGQKKAALAAFEQSFERFADSNKAPDSMLRSGDVLDALGQSDSARSRYQTLIDTYPKARAAKKAQERLQAMDDQGVADE